MAQQLTDYPRPTVAVDVAVLSVAPATDRSPGQLVALLLERSESPLGHVLAGRFIRERQTIQDTVGAILVDKLHLSPSLGGARPRLLRVFDDPDRDERGWVMSIGHMIALPWDYVARANGEWVPINSRGRLARARTLLFDHPTILAEAVESMRDRYETEPDPDRLLTGPFTLLELRRLHEAVLGAEIRKDTFSRRMRGQLEETDEVPDVRPVGRPAQYYLHPRRAATRSTDSLWRLPRA